MNCLVLVSSIFLAQTPDFAERARHPLAPSLPRLTRQEEKKIEAVIERMIQADIGKLKGTDAKKALDDFSRLGPEATFLLIDGLNRAADMESSCPAIIIAKKLAGVFLKTDDIDLLTFAKENIGAGVTAKRHLNALKDLRFQCQMRKATLQQRGRVSVGSMSLADLEKAAAKERGPQLRVLLMEAEKRQGAKAVDVLVHGLRSADPESAKLSQGLLPKNLQRQPGSVLKALLRHERREVRIAAAQEIGAKKLRFGAELIELLREGDPDLHQAARRALVQLSGGMDHGPAADASFTDREAARERWQAWWNKQK